MSRPGRLAGLQSLGGSEPAKESPGETPRQAGKGRRRLPAPMPWTVTDGQARRGTELSAFADGRVRPTLWQEPPSPVSALFCIVWQVLKHTAPATLCYSDTGSRGTKATLKGYFTHKTQSQSDVYYIHSWGLRLSLLLLHLFPSCSSNPSNTLGPMWEQAAHAGHSLAAPPGHRILTGYAGPRIVRQHVCGAWGSGEWGHQAEGRALRPDLPRCSNAKRPLARLALAPAV